MTMATTAARRERLTKQLAALAVAALVLVAWPPLHVHRLRDSANGQADDRSDREARSLADGFWAHTLVAGAAKPVDIRSLVELLQENPSAARGYGHSADYGGNPSYLLQGTGRVTSIDGTGLWLDVGAANAMKVVLLDGPIFGNVLRDATGTFPMKNLGFPQFNAVSEELDRLSETQGEEGLRGGVKAGALLRIVAAGEVDDSGAYPVLELAPIRVMPQ